MPWRRFRKKVERPIDVSRSIEESLEDAAEGEEQEDLTELAELDDATIAEAATGEPDEDRAPTDLGDKIREAFDSDAPHRVGLPRSAPRGVAMDRRPGAARSEDPHAAPRLPARREAGSRAHSARGLRLAAPLRLRRLSRRRVRRAQ